MSNRVKMDKKVPVTRIYGISGEFVYHYYSSPLNLLIILSSSSKE